MTPKEKAKELVEKFYLSEAMGGYGEVPRAYYESAKTCALICVDEIIKVVPYVKKLPHLLNTETVEFWNEVKNEIRKM